MLAADIHIDLHDLTEDDLTEIQARIEDAVAPHVVVNGHTATDAYHRTTPTT